MGAEEHSKGMPGDVTKESTSPTMQQGTLGSGAVEVSKAEKRNHRLGSLHRVRAVCIPNSDTQDNKRDTFLPNAWRGSYRGGDSICIVDRSNGLCNFLGLPSPLTVLIFFLVR